MSQEPQESRVTSHDSGLFSLVGVWEKSAEMFPDEEAIVDQTRRLTWSQAKEEIDRLAAGMVSLGIGRDEVVVGQIPNVIESVTLRLAMEKAGIICLAGVMAWRETELEHILTALRAVAVVAPWQYEGFNYGEMYQRMAGRLPRLKHLVFWGPGGPSSGKAEAMCYGYGESPSSGKAEAMRYGYGESPSSGKAEAMRYGYGERLLPRSKQYDHD